MNRWSNNYYSHQAGRDTPRPQGSTSPLSTQGPTSRPSSTQSRRSSIVKAGGNGVVSLCVFRVAHLTQLTLRSFIERQGVRVFHIEQTSHRGAAYRSFVVAVAERDAPKLLNKGFWPGLVACRPLQDGDPGRNEVISRRYSREAVLPASKTDDTSPRGGRWSSRESGALIDKPRTVQLVAAEPYSARNNSEQVRRERKGASSTNPSVNKGKNDKDPTNPPKERLQASKNSLPEKVSNKSVVRKVGMSARLSRKTAVVKVKRKISAENTPEKQKVTKTTTIKVKRKVSDEKEFKRQAPNDVSKENTQTLTSKTSRTKKSSFANFSNITKNKKKSASVVSKKSSTGERVLGHGMSAANIHPQKPNVSPLRASTVNTKYKNLSSNTNLKENSKENFSKPKQTQLTWLRPLQTLLRVSPEEAMGRLLGPDFDRLIIEENISDEELFLGVKVLAHCARANVRPNVQQNLVYRIWQPQVITLIKEFTRTVEEKYKERADSYFWHLGEFLDLYIVHNIFLQGMLSLFTTCLSKILALSYRKYVSEDLVKVYRAMHTKVFSNLP